MARHEEGLLDLLVEVPWWISIAFFVVSFVALRFAIPAFLTRTASDRAMGQAISEFAWLTPIFLVTAGISAVRFARKSKMLDRQSGIDSIRALSWKQFEELLGEAYRRQGFSVTENSSLGADGGVDLTIRRAGSTYLVQCKQWRTYKVGVRVIREMFGLMTAKRAAGAIIVTSGAFTKEARDFAEGKPIELVDGDRLVGLVRGVQTHSPVAMPNRAVAAPPSMATALRACPKCGRDLVVREAKRGPSAGGKFWGCQGYPQCRHTEQYLG